MDTQKLHDLIDRVIGKKGPLRVPSYWMRKVLKEVMGWVQSRINDLTKIINSKVDLVNSYTYSQIKALKDSGRLVPGQTYCLIDYRPTLSKDVYFTTVVYSIINTFEQPIIYLTAQSNRAFFAEAIYLIEGRECEILFEFDRRHDIYDWSLGNNEYDEIFAHTSEGDQLSLTVGEVTRKGVLTYNAIGNVFGYINCDDRTIQVGNSVAFTDPSGVEKYVIIDEIIDKYRGLIYRFKDLHREMDIPCDPSITISFKVLLPTSVAGSWQNSYQYGVMNDFKNTVVESYYANSCYSIPPVVRKGQGNMQCHIKRDCAYIVIDVAGATRGYVVIDQGCREININQSRDYNSNSNITTVDIHIPTKSSNVNINAASVRTNEDFFSVKGLPVGTYMCYLKGAGTVIFNNDIVNKAWFYINNNPTTLIVRSNVDGGDNYKKIVVNADDKEVYILDKGIEGNISVSKESEIFERVSKIMFDGNGTKFLSDDGIYKPITPATVVDEATGDNLDSMLPFKLVIEDPTLPISAEDFNKLKAAMLANRPIYIITGGIAFIALVTPATNDSRLIATILVPNMDSTVKSIVMAFLPDEAPEILTEPDNPTYMVKAGQGLNIELDGTINCTLDISQLSQELQTLKARVDALEGGSLTE